jgi:hypothetical protein
MPDSDPLVGSHNHEYFVKNQLAIHNSHSP